MSSSAATFAGQRAGSEDPLSAPYLIQAIEGRWPFVLAFALLFTVTYFEPLTILGLKFATIWRLVFVIPVLLLIISRPFQPTIRERELEPLFWASLAFTLAPLLSLGFDQSSFRAAIETCAQRGFPIIALMLIVITARLDWADLLVRAFPLFLCLVSVPILLGVLETAGGSLEAVAGVSVNAYASVFQNVHSAALAQAIATLCAFALLVGFPGRHSVMLLAIVLIGVVLTAMTTARAGLLALIVGMVASAVLMRQMKFFIVMAALSALLALLVAAARPELIELATNRLLGRNIYMLDTSADAMTSGRLTLQTAALLAYLDHSWTGQLFGVGTSASMQAIGRYSGFYLIAHNAFVDELISHGALGLIALLAVFGAAGRLAWKNARAGRPAGFSLVLAFAVYALFQGVDYSLQLSLVGLVLYLDTHARVAASSS